MSEIKRDPNLRSIAVLKALDMLEAIMQNLAVIGYNSPDMPVELRTVARMTHTDLEKVVEALNE